MRHQQRLGTFPCLIFRLATDLVQDGVQRTLQLRGQVSTEVQRQKAQAVSGHHGEEAPLCQGQGPLLLHGVRNDEAGAVSCLCCNYMPQYVMNVADAVMCRRLAPLLLYKPRHVSKADQLAGRRAQCGQPLKLLLTHHNA